MILKTRYKDMKTAEEQTEWFRQWRAMTEEERAEYRRESDQKDAFDRKQENVKRRLDMFVDHGQMIGSNALPDLLHQQAELRKKIEAYTLTDSRKPEIGPLFLGDIQVPSDVEELAAAADAADGLISIPDLLREMKYQQDQARVELEEKRKKALFHGVSY